MTLVHKRLWTPDDGFKSFPLFYCPNAGYGFEDKSFTEKEGRENEHETEKNMGGWINQHPGRPDYRADSRRVNGKYRNSRMVCRTANLPRRAIRGSDRCRKTSDRGQGTPL